MKNSELPKKFKGKYVTRAAFAKLQGEKNRLEKDIYIMVMADSVIAVEVMKKWKKKFMQDKWLADALREMALKELPKLKEKYGII